MNAHTTHPHTAAAVQALEAAQEMEERVQEATDLCRTLMQIGTHFDVVPDTDDRLMFLTMTRLLDTAVGKIDELRRGIQDACHSAKHGAGKLVA